MFFLYRLVALCLLMTISFVICAIQPDNIQPSNSINLQVKNLAFITDALPVGLVNEPYLASLEITGGNQPYHFSVSNGTIPEGLKLDRQDGSIRGRPTRFGEFSFAVSVKDNKGNVAKQFFIIFIDKSLGCESCAQGMPTKNHTNKNNLNSKQNSIFAKRSTSPDLSNLLNIISQMNAGEWSRVNLNAFSSAWTPAELRPLYGWGNPTPSKLIECWSSFAWDTNRGNLFLYGGGHANYSGNDTYLWRGSSQIWDRGSLPSEVITTPLGYSNAIDGVGNAPASAHTYDNTIFLPILDRVLVLGGASDPNGGLYLTQPTPTTTRITGPYLFDPNRANPDMVGGTTGSHVQRVAPHPEVVGGNMWTNRESWLNASTNSAPPTEALVNGCTGYAEENGLDTIYVRTAYRLYRYVINDINNPALDTWTQVGQYYYGGSGGQSTCTYDPVRKFFISTYDSKSKPFIFWNMATASAGNKDTLVTPNDPNNEFLGLLSSGAININNCAMDLDPVRNNLKLWCGDGRVWTLTPPATATANNWSIVKEPSPLGAVPTESIGTGILGKWKYIPNLDVFMGLLDAVQGNIWIYKPVGWVNPNGNSNAFPSVNLTSPQNNSSYTDGVAIPLSASASDIDGTIQKVEFFDNSTKIGESTAAPYSMNWIGGALGTHSLTAKATDNLGGMNTSSAILVTINPINVNNPPSISWVQPIDGYSLTVGTSVTLIASALDSNGIQMVEFFDSGTKIGESTVAPYSMDWVGGVLGTHSLTAKATDNLGAANTTSSITVNVNPISTPNTPPSVNLTSPQNGSSFTLGTTILLSASASDIDGTIQKVEFFDSGIKLGESTTASSTSYSMTWVGGGVGSHYLTAKATDNAGGVNTSSAILVTINSNIPPSVSWDKPTNGSSFTVGSAISLSVLATDIDGTIQKVEFFDSGTKIGESTSAPYGLSWIAQIVGTHSLTATATDNSGATTTAQLSVNIVSSSTTTDTTVTLQRVAGQNYKVYDTFLDSYHPTLNFGSATYVQDTNQNIYVPLLRFAIFASEGGPVPNGSTIKSAILSSYKYSYYDMNYSAFRILQDWSESAATWNNRMLGASWTAAGARGIGTDVNASPDASALTDWNPGWVNFDIKNALQQMSSSVILSNFGWKLQGVSGTTSGLKRFYTSEYTDPTLRPKLVITYGTGTGNAPPAVNFTSPQNGSSFTVGTTIPLSASASDVDGTIQKIEFFDSGTKIGESNVAPFTIDWLGGVVGAHSLTAKATDNLGAATTSSSISVTVNPIIAANTPPSISWVQPINGININSGTSVLLGVSAIDTDGQVVKVEFFADGSKLGEVAQSPYSMTWTTPSVGTHSLTARATDNAGAQTSTGALSINVVTLPTTDTTVTLQRVAGQNYKVYDTFLDSYHPTLNFGGSTYFQDTNQNIYVPLLRFAIFTSEGGPVPNGSTIKSAVLSSYKYSYYDMNYSAFRVLQDWSESAATWNNRMLGASWATAGARGVGSDVSASPDASALTDWNPGWVNFDVKNALQQMSSSVVLSNFGWKLQGVSGTTSGLKRFYTSEYTDPTLRPKLVITYGSP